MSVRDLRRDLPAPGSAHHLDRPPARVDAAFDSWIWPLLGLIFLPFATLIYVILWQAGGLSGWDWFWVAVAALFDLGHWGASAAQRRAQTTA